LDASMLSRVWNDSQITAHHAIIPTRHTFDMTKLTADELKVYQLIRQYYLAQFLPAQETDVTEVTLNIGGQLFQARGRVSVATGWKALFAREQDEKQEEKPDENTVLPELKKEETCQVNGAEIQPRQTRPPAPFTEGTLIAAMKN
ncbi:DNA topoisomerase, partial [Xenorhabdus bovienii]